MSMPPMSVPPDAPPPDPTNGAARRPMPSLADDRRLLAELEAEVASIEVQLGALDAPA